MIVVLSGCMQELRVTPGTAPTAATTRTAQPAIDPSGSQQPVFQTQPAPQPTLAATAEPTALPPPTVIAPTNTSLPTLVVPTPIAQRNEDRWRAQQLNREVFVAPQPYRTTGSELWWYDPINQQRVVLGNFSGDFLAQAQFILLGLGVEALEVPYQINTSYGLTALSPALLARIQAAGYDGEWIETYVLLTPNVTTP